MGSKLFNWICNTWWYSGYNGWVDSTSTSTGICNFGRTRTTGASYFFLLAFQPLILLNAVWTILGIRWLHSVCVFWRMLRFDYWTDCLTSAYDWSSYRTWWWVRTTLSYSLMFLIGYCRDAHGVSKVRLVELLEKKRQNMKRLVIGALVDLISLPVSVGFTSATAIIIMTTQLKVSI